MKYPIELNGIANLHAILDMGYGGDMPTDCHDQIKQQLDLLERYTIAYVMAVNNGTEIPFWHDIKANPEKYPLRKDLK